MNVLYLLTQKKEQRTKIGISKNLKDRIKQLEKSYGVFDDDSLFFVFDEAKMSNNQLKILDIERSLHIILKALGLQKKIKEGELKEGYLEFFRNENKFIIDVILNNFFNLIPDILLKREKPFFKISDKESDLYKKIELSSLNYIGVRYSVLENYFGKKIFPIEINATTLINSLNKKELGQINFYKQIFEDNSISIYKKEKHLKCFLSIFYRGYIEQTKKNNLFRKIDASKEKELFELISIFDNKVVFKMLNNFIDRIKSILSKQNNYYSIDINESLLEEIKLLHIINIFKDFIFKEEEK